MNWALDPYSKRPGAPLMKVSYFIYATIDNPSAMPSLAEFEAGGINAAPLEMVCYRDIAAVVSAIDVDFSLGEASTEQKEATNLMRDIVET